MNWDLWQLATHPKIKDSYVEIRDQWNIDEVVEALAVTNALDVAEADSDK